MFLYYLVQTRYFRLAAWNWSYTTEGRQIIASMPRNFSLCLSLVNPEKCIWKMGTTEYRTRRKILHVNTSLGSIISREWGKWGCVVRKDKRAGHSFLKGQEVTWSPRSCPERLPKITVSPMGKKGEKGEECVYWSPSHIISQTCLLLAELCPPT